MEFLLHLIGEYAVRTHNWEPLQELIEANVDELKIHGNLGFVRLLLALKTIKMIHNGERINAMKEWALALAKATGAAPNTFREQDISATAACPHCGKPLRTAKAKQCYHCGMDWHDPENIRWLPIR